MSNENFRILIVDDEESFLLLMTRILSDEKYTVKAMADPVTALSAIEAFSPNLVISDLRMPVMDGMSFMEIVRKERDIDFIMITAFATVETAVEAMKKGAADYITKPLQNPDQLRIAVNKIYERQLLVGENSILKAVVAEGLPDPEIMFAGMPLVMKSVLDVASTDATVLLLGETGTGKTMISKFIHSLSRRKGPFIDVNCAAIPENLLESEMFGHEKGAFTGALALKKGRFEIADRGTILLDEISEMSLTLQVKFLRVLQEKTFERVGSPSSLTTNARIIAATNRELRQMSAEGKFREDLFYRLNVFPIEIPPLRKRADHIERLALHIAKRIARRLGKMPKTISTAAINSMKTYSWPGNIRELENIIERAMIVSISDELDISLPDKSCERNASIVSCGDLKSIERDAIEKALTKSGGSRKKAASLLSISLRSLQYKIKEYGLN